MIGVRIVIRVRVRIVIRVRVRRGNLSESDPGIERGDSV